MIPLLLPRRAAQCESMLLPVREGASGEWLNAVVCDEGKPKPHRGKHRAKLGRVRVRWTDAEAATA